MLRLIITATVLLLFRSVGGFAPVHPNVKQLPTERTSLCSLDAAKDENIFSKLNLDNVLKNSDDIFQNSIGGGEPGKRGEVYVITQSILFLCLALGFVPGLDAVLQILLGPVLVVAAAGVVLAAINDMGASLSPWPVPAGDKLITKGVFAYVRHPIYAAVLCAGFGLSVWTESSSRLIITMALFVLFELKSDFEEKKLIKEYGDEYKDYQKKVTGKFVPNSLLSNLPGIIGDD